MNARNEKDFTALIYAAREGRTETVKALIQAGADCKLQDTKIRLYGVKACSLEWSHGHHQGLDSRRGGCEGPG